jgi:hypothetical protein
MALNRDIAAVIRETQELVFRVCKGNGLTLKAISLDSGIPYSTLRTYAGNNGTTAIMGIDTMYQLVGVVPDELLSLLLPEGRAIVQVPSEIDHDEFEKMCRDYLAAKGSAHQVASPGGREISDCERDLLDGKVVQLRAAA